MKADDSTKNGELDSKIAKLKFRDEILQLMYWMTGEGFGPEFSVADLERFIQDQPIEFAHDLEWLVTSGLLERKTDNKFELTEQGTAEGGRRFADEFESMLKPGHFECDEPDCDCHNPDSWGEACKHLSPTFDAN